ncbi:MAG TPA: 2-oxoglutarate dehydrogenase E1 component, partial [Thermoanaerobaculia bacterium]|nr:2-oxoglutarate dehydrogenase E1 component [Thermoanaerobaculia bacterium]
LLSGLVLLLPHGFEGQGPEHSSARMERFLQLAAEDNLQIAQPSTAAQYFHLLRRQALQRWRKPLVVFTPKSMLRHKASASPLAELAAPRFRKVIGDGQVEGASRVLVASGKVGHDLAAERAKREADDVAIVFVDQLYPFPRQELEEELERHPEAERVVWVQEEPANMGPLYFVRHDVERAARRIAGEHHFRKVTRSASASPATGSAGAHQQEQKQLLALAFEVK